MPGLKKIKRLRTKKLKKFEALDFRETSRYEDLPKFEVYKIERDRSEVDLLEYYTRRLNGDARTAKRLLTLREEFPSATLPELVTMDWLNREKSRYIYQAALFGGRTQRGGIIPDFIVFNGGKAIAWLVQGSYFHSQAFQNRYSQQGRDAAAKMRLLGAVISGIRITGVVELLESDILSNPHVFLDALVG